MALQGALTAMVTPFKQDGQIDWDRLAANVEFQIKKGINGLVPMGTTGESPTLNHEEHRAVIAKVIEWTKKRVPICAGTGSNSTAEAVDLTRHAKQAGADAALVVNPYYNKPTQEGLFRHFSAVADVGLPVILYNIPGRTGVQLTPQTIARLAKHPAIVGIKEATGSLDVASEIAALCDPEKFTILSGDDSLTLPLMSVGGKGVISVLSNLIPDQVAALTKAGLAGDFPAARRMHLKLFPLFKGMFVETNPIPIKAAMQMLKMDSGTLRLPMCEISDANRTFVQSLLREAGLLS